MLRTVLLAFCVIACSAKKSYDGYQVLRMPSLDEAQIQSLFSLEDVQGLDFWHFPSDLMVSPSHMESVKEYLDAKNIAHDVWIQDVQTLIDAQLSDKPRTEAFDYTVYHTLAEIYGWVDEMNATYPNEVTKISIGTSHEGRDLAGLKFGVDTGKVKRAVYFQGGIHAREWVSPASVMWMTNELLYQNSIGNQGIVSLLEYYDFYVVPVLNTDGYEFTWTNDRMWRKNRTPNAGSNCIGTDLNRNFGYMWGGQGSSPLECSETYRGTGAFSEPESQAVETACNQISQTQILDLFIDYHSYGQMVLSAWGYTDTLPADYAAMDAGMKTYADAVLARHGKVYVTGSGASLYITSGDTVDWSYGDSAVINSYTVELRDEGQFGFLLPEAQIVPTAEENYDGLTALLNTLTP